MKKLFTILVALSAIGLIVSGCSKADEPAADGGTAGAPATPTETK